MLIASCGGDGDGDGGSFFAPAPPSITTTSLDDGIQNQSFSDTIDAIAGTVPFTWRETTDSFDTNGMGASGTPCEGLTLDLSATGRSVAISGTPVTSGTCGPFTIEVEDSASPPGNDMQDLSIRIADPLVITTTTVPNGTDDVAYSAPIDATGGIGPFDWSVSSGSLPPGLNFSATTTNTASVNITGTPTTGGSFDFTLEVTDSAAPAQSATQSFSAVLVLEITSSNLPDGVENQAYRSGPLTVAGEVAPVTWDATGLPSFLSIDSSTGEISGTPASADVGSFNVTVEVTDSDTPTRTDIQAFTLRIAAELIITTTDPLPSTQEAASYSATISATGGLSPFAWSEPTTFFDQSTGEGALDTPCEGLTLDLTATAASTTISGTPVNDGDCGPFIVRIDDSAMPAQFDEKSFTITVGVGLVTILTTSLPDGAVDSQYSVAIQGTGGQEPYTWSVESGPFDPSTGDGNPGTPCEGLTLDVGATGDMTTISGTPVTDGTCGTFTLGLADSKPTPEKTTQDLSISINPAAEGRNDSIATATPLTTNGDRTITASISPFADPLDTTNPDNDFYELTATGGNVVTVEVTARRLSPPSPLDSVIEIVDSSGNRFTTCLNEGTTDGVNPGSTDPTPNAFDDQCLNDDIDLGVIQDSKLEFEVPGSGTVAFFVRVLDWRGDARPDMIYELNILGAD